MVLAPLARGINLLGTDEPVGIINQEVLEIGDVRLDAGRHEVFVRGDPVPLPLKEFELLELLLANAGRVLTRDVLIDRIELRLGPAIDTLRSLPVEEMFDLAFIDADKGGYLGYWREVVPRVRPGGLIMVDNTFSHGRVIDAGNDNPLVIAVRDFNDHAAADDRVDVVMVPIGDGLTLARKRD